MHARVAAVVAAVLLLAGCASTEPTPSPTGTQVDLSRNNYRVVRANAVGRSGGFSLLGILPVKSPSYTEAMAVLYRDAELGEGSAHALANFTQERSSSYYLLFSLPELTVRADVVEFTE